MTIIKRNYLDMMIRVIGTPDIKVITGVRRSGKSELLKLFIKHLKNTDDQANIIHINYSLSKYDNLRDYEKLNDYIESKYVSGMHNFILIDEVQMCEGFERAINNFHALQKYDIYITGSNAFLMSSDLATLFTGRTFEIEIYPFSYKEFLQYYKLENTDDNFDRYVREGGMPGSYEYTNIEDKYKYIEDIFKTLLVRDIKEKYDIRDEQLLEKITGFLIDNISNLTSVLNVSNTLNSNKIPTNDKTVGNYISYLCQAYLFYKINRYDIAGKKHLVSSNKYYLCDPSFRYALHGTKNLDFGRTYENIVAIELLRRGYEVYIGILYDKEVDFIAIKRDEKLYIQVADNISDEATFEREISPLLKIKDAYPKMIVARTRHENYQYEGIRIKNITDFLAE